MGNWTVKGSVTNSHFQL